MTSKVFTSRGIPESIGEAIEQVAVAFGEVGNYAKVSCVYPILECRHNIIKSAAREATEVIKHVKTENFGALWNHPEMGNQTFDMLKDRIKHFHVCDDIFGPDNGTYGIWRSA